MAQAWWGRVFADLFGYSYTTLTWSTLVLSWAGILCFYGLLRRLSLPPGAALFGALVLLFNPIYLHLSYSFMSDVPFLTLVLAATLALVRAFQVGDDRWYLIGMLLAALAVLVRQLGVLIPLAALAYLVLARSLTWRRLLLAAPPFLVLAVYMAWQAGNPVAEEATSRYVFSGLGGAAGLSDLISSFGTQVIQVLLVSCIFGLWLLPVAPLLLQLRARRAWVLPAAALGLLMLVSYLRVDGLGGFPLDHSYSVLDSAGFLILSGTPKAAPPLLVPAVWALLTVGGFALTAWLLAGAGSHLQAHLQALWRRRVAARFDFLWILGFAFLLGPIWTPRPYDRYFLPVLPLLLIPLLFRLARGGRRTWIAAGTLLATVALFTVLAQADFADRAEAHWRAANQLLAQGVDRNDIDGGFEWQGAHFFDAIGTLLPFRPQLKDATGHVAPLPFEVEETHLAGYHIIGQVPYFSRLGGFTWRASYLLAQDGVVGGPR